MTEPIRDPTIQGKTIQFRWTEGPTKGMTHEHVFHPDGTVEWRDAEPSRSASTGKRPGQGEPPERPAYAAVPVADEAFLVSYLARSGYTLTAVLNFRDRQLIGFASSAKEWFPVRGTFEVMK
jgi:MoaF N-terminal domain